MRSRIPARDAARRLRREFLTGLDRGVRTGDRVRRSGIRLGSAYGGWEVLPELISSSSVIYSFGVGDDVSWDLSLITRFGVQVNAFDPTPRCIQWVQSQELPPSFVFHPLGLADFDGRATFAMRNEHPEWSSYNLMRAGDEPSGASEIVHAPVARLETIMSRLGHERIDVLKMDIEGAEYEAIPDILGSGIFPAQLLVEFHYFEQAAAERRGATDRLIRSLNDHGYRSFWRSPIGYEFGFVLG